MPHINMNEILELKDVMEDAFGELVNAYVEDSETKLQGLHIALENKDIKKIAQLGHSLKGASANIGARPLSAIFCKIEDQGRAGEWTGVDTFINEAQQEFNAVKVELLAL